MRTGQIFAVVSLVAVMLAPNKAPAITAELAKKCNALVAKQFPPREPGNPAAGSAKGSGRDQQNAFKTCVENGGNIDTSADKTSK